MKKKVEEEGGAKKLEKDEEEGEAEKNSPLIKNGNNIHLRKEREREVRKWGR